MRRAASRLPQTLTLVLLAWLAQLCLPAVHAAMMAEPRAQLLGWCGDPVRARAMVAELPAEIRQAMDPDGTSSADHLAACTLLCATGSTPAPTTAVAATMALRVAGLEITPADRPTPVSREQAPRPPAQGPPAQA